MESGQPVSELRVPNLSDINHERLRGGRLERLQTAMRERGAAVCLFFLPANIRYATGTDVMGIYTLGTFARYCLVPAQGKPILFEYASATHESTRFVEDVRPAAYWQFSGDQGSELAGAWAQELRSTLSELGVAGEAVSLDRLDANGFLALQEAGIKITDATPITSDAREVKTPEEVAICMINGAVGDAMLHEFESSIHPGVRELDLLATMWDTLIRNQGEMIFTRLVASGQNTNPWGNEAGDKLVMPGDLVAVDTDANAYGGYLVDISRTFLCGERPTPEQGELYRIAHECVVGMREIARAGVSYEEFARAAPTLPERYAAQRYECMVHGAGLEDEGPTIYYPGQKPNRVDAHLQENMVLCFECYVGEVGGAYGVKLEDQVLITARGAQLLSTYPYDGRLLGA